MHSTEKLQTLLNAAFEKEIFSSSPKELYEPFHYLLALGGKRLRPLFVLMACDMFGGKVEDAISPAMATELFHNFTLMHDDIMDQAPLRRGMPTVHEKFNTNIAILSGDVMLVYAYQYLLKVNEKILKPIIQSFNETAIKVCEGQQLDMNYEKQEASLSQYLEMIELKTAALIAGSLKIGALIANANEKDVERIYEFGKNIGIAFQLQDDILDTFGDGNKFGKQVGGDIMQNKKTILYLKALELSDEKTKKELKQLFNSNTKNHKNKVKKVIAIFQKLNVLKYSEKIKQHYLKTANRHLESIRIPNERKEEIKKLSAHLLNREN